MLLRRRWQSIDRKLPLLASGLVLVTVAVLGWSAYVLFERVLLERAGFRMLSSARIVTQMFGLPQRRMDVATRTAEHRLVEFLRGRAGRQAATAALASLSNPRDTAVFHTALLDASGRVLLDSHRPNVSEPRWAPAVVGSGGAQTNGGLTIGPIERVDGLPVMSYVYALHDSSDSSNAPVGFVAQSRTIATGRSARLIRDMIGSGVTMKVGQPGTGEWTDLERIVPAPPPEALSSAVVDVDGSVAASSTIPGSRWVVWVSQRKHDILTPTRTLLWTMFPLGLLIAVVGAALMWRIARRIATPIVQLTAAVEGVAQDARLMPTASQQHAPSQDEVTRLRVAFERMAARIADREALELQLRHAQKMEAVGRLAGGIAHDFNNLLTAVRSYADLLIVDMPEWDPRRADVEEIRKATTRATQLTSQLLAYSRKQLLQPRVLAIDGVLTDLQPMLRRLLIENIELVVDAPHGLWPVRADRGQLEQVIMNFAVNARDAMPDGGVLLIRAWNEVVVTPIRATHGPVPIGEYVAISVSDTGLGMDDVTQARAFEPFFTTKPVGRGTGLGLATVHGIVAQSNGHLTLVSRPGFGTTFTVYLPRELKRTAQPERVSREVTESA
jgi:signal transduction histidine kinase